MLPTSAGRMENLPRSQWSWRRKSPLNRRTTTKGRQEASIYFICPNEHTVFILLGPLGYYYTHGWIGGSTIGDLSLHQLHHRLCHWSPILRLNLNSVISKTKTLIWQFSDSHFYNVYLWFNPLNPDLPLGYVPWPWPPSGDIVIDSTEIPVGSLRQFAEYRPHKSLQSLSDCLNYSKY